MLKKRGKRYILCDGDWYRITTPYACFAIIVKDGIVVDSAPISRKSIGRKAEDVFAFYRRRFNATIEKID